MRMNRSEERTKSRKMGKLGEGNQNHRDGLHEKRGRSSRADGRSRSSRSRSRSRSEIRNSRRRSSSSCRGSSRSEMRSRTRGSNTERVTRVAELSRGSKRPYPGKSAVPRSRSPSSNSSGRGHSTANSRRDDRRQLDYTNNKRERDWGSTRDSGGTSTKHLKRATSPSFSRSRSRSHDPSRKLRVGTTSTGMGAGPMLLSKSKRPVSPSSNGSDSSRSSRSSSDKARHSGSRSRGDRMRTARLNSSRPRRFTPKSEGPPGSHEGGAFRSTSTGSTGKDNNHTERGRHYRRGSEETARGDASVQYDREAVPRNFRKSHSTSLPREHSSRHPTRRRWSPSPSPTAPTASETVRRSQSYRANRGDSIVSGDKHERNGVGLGKNGVEGRGSPTAPSKSIKNHVKERGSPSQSSRSSYSSSPDARRRRQRRRLPRDESSHSKGEERGAILDDDHTNSVGNTERMKGPSTPMPAEAEDGAQNGSFKKKSKKKGKKKSKKKSKKGKHAHDKNSDRSKRNSHGSVEPRQAKDRGSDGGRGQPSRRTLTDGLSEQEAPMDDNPRPRRSKDLKLPNAPAKYSKAINSSTPAVNSTSASTGKDKSSTGKKTKRPALPVSLLSFEEEGEDGDGAKFQGLGAATLNEFKRTHRKSQADSVATAAAASSTTDTGGASASAAEDGPSVTTRLGLLMEKKKNAVLGPSKISTAESRGEREYQEDRHTVVSCLHAPDDAHTKFDACPPCFWAVYDGHNGHLASDIAKSKLHTYVAKAAPTTGLRGEPKERLEGLLRAAFASTEAEILKQTAEDDGREDGTTVTACLLVGNLLVTANVGDSRAVLGSMGLSEKLRCKSLSSDHKPEDPYEKRRIKAAGGDVVFNGCYRVQHENVGCRLAVSRSLGDRQFKGQGGQPHGSQVPPPPDMKGQLVSPEPSVKSVLLEPQDRVVIVGSDGLWDVMTGLEAVGIALAAHGRAPSTAGRAPSWATAIATSMDGEKGEADPANALVKEAMKRGTSDNVTAVVAVLLWD